MWSKIFSIPWCGIWAMFYSPAAGRKQKKLLRGRSFAPADVSMSPLQRTEACSHNWKHGAQEQLHKRLIIARWQTPQVDPPATQNQNRWFFCLFLHAPFIKLLPTVGMPLTFQALHSNPAALWLSHCVRWAFKLHMHATINKSQSKELSHKSLLRFVLIEWRVGKCGWKKSCAAECVVQCCKSFYAGDKQMGDPADEVEMVVVLVIFPYWQFMLETQYLLVSREL